MTVAVDAAAHVLYVDVADGAWADAPPLVKKDFRESVLKSVVAALEALPDRSESTLVRAGSYLTENMWCHHEGCATTGPPGAACDCGLEQLLEELQP